MRVPVPGPVARRRAVAAGWTLWGVGFMAAATFGAIAALWFGAGALAAILASGALAMAVVWFVRRSRGEATVGLVPPVVQVRATRRPVPVPASAPDGVQACMNCGSPDVVMPGIRDGVAVGGGELQLHVCRNCNTRAPPLLFDRGEDYVAFVQALHER